MTNDAFEVWAALCGFDLPDIRRRIDAAPLDDREQLLSLLEQAKASASARVGKDGKSFATTGAVAMLTVITKDLELLPKARTLRRTQRERAKKPRTPREINEAIDAARTREGTAKEQWGYLRARLEEEGFDVRDALTECGGVAYEIHTPTAGDAVARDPFPFSLKAFQNRPGKKKSRQPG